MMRDHPEHAELIMAGMWGGIAGTLGNMMEMAVHYYEGHSNQWRWVDQDFLRDVVWPTIKNRCCTHDSIFQFGLSATGFPADAPVIVGSHGRLLTPNSGSREQNKKRAPSRAPMGVLGYYYWSKERTSCDVWLACASIAVPACCSTCVFASTVVSYAKSASKIRPLAAAILVLFVVRLLIVAWRRFWTAPRSARFRLTASIAESIWVRPARRQPGT